MRKIISKINPASVLNKGEQKRIHKGGDGYYGHGACYSNSQCPSYSSCECGQCVSWTGEDDGTGGCN